MLVECFLFQSHPEIFDSFKQFLNIAKPFNYSIVGHPNFQYTDHVMTMSFITIDSTDDSFNIIIPEFNV